MNTLDLFVSLFRGRGDCYGHWDGGCVREKLTRERFASHLDGSEHIGVYPAFNVGDVTSTVWGCTDIDYDKVEEPLAISSALAAKGVTSWLEKTRKGYHLWAFATTLVPAVDMRRMFLAAHQVVGVPAKEVNPKQEKLVGNQVGNYVRLPYPGGLEERRIYLDGERLDVDNFVAAAHASRTTPETVAELAAYWTPPKATSYITSQPSQDMQQAARALSPVGRIIFRDGPLPERDRSTTLLRLAYECRDAGLAPEDCLILMEDADLRWGKFMQRPNGQTELIKLIVKSYGQAPGPSTSP